MTPFTGALLGLFGGALVWYGLHRLGRWIDAQQRIADRLDQPLIASRTSTSTNAAPNPPANSNSFQIMDKPFGMSGR